MNRRSLFLTAIGLASVAGLASARASEPGSSPLAVPGALGPVPVATNRLDLNQAIALALVHNPELRAAEGRVEAAAGRASRAGLWPNPELELSAEEWPVNAGAGFSDAKQTIGVSQTIPFPGKKGIEGRIGELDRTLSEMDRELRRASLVREVKSGFYRVLAAEGLVALAGDLVRVAELSAGTARKRVEAGDLALQEQLRAEVQLEQVRSEQVEYRRELVAARQALAAILGRPDLVDARLEGGLADRANMALLAEGTEKGLAGHAALAAARSWRDRTELAARRARLEPYPDVRLGVAGGWEGSTENGIVEFRVSVPLPVIDRGKGQRQEAKADLAVAAAELAATEQRLRRDWATASQRFESAAEQATAYRERVLPRANEALRLVQSGFEQGKFSFIDLLDTQRTTAEVRLAYQQKLLELNLAEADLEALLEAARGRGDSASVGTVATPR